MLTLVFPVPRYQKGQGLRTSQEGQVMVGRRWSFHYGLSHSSHLHTCILAKAIRLCILLRMLTVLLHSSSMNHYAHAEKFKIHDRSLE